MHVTHNTLDLAIRENAVQLLNAHLAAAIDLQGQMKQAHWSLRGPGFIALHELFDRVAGVAGDSADLLAEHCAGMGGTPLGTVQVAAAGSFLVPYKVRLGDAAEHVFAVSAALAAFGQSVRGAAARAGAFGDGDTADLLTQISRAVHRQLWLVEAHAAPVADVNSAA